MDLQPSRTRAPRVLTGVVLALLLGGCSSLNPGTAEAANTAARFHADLASGDARAACALLAPGTVEKLEDGAAGSCARKLADLGLPGAATSAAARPSAATPRFASRRTRHSSRSRGSTGRSPPSAARRAARNPTTAKWRETDMRWAFWICLGVIVLGLAYMLAIGVLAR